MGFFRVDDDQQIAIAEDFTENSGRVSNFLNIDNISKIKKSSEFGALP